MPLLLPDLHHSKIWLFVALETKNQLCGVNGRSYSSERNGWTVSDQLSTICINYRRSVLLPRSIIDDFGHFVTVEFFCSRVLGLIRGRINLRFLHKMELHVALF